jgi:succinoglycan biosynthesis protein ExoM
MKKTLVAICIASYRRPEGLRRLLRGLDKLTFDKCELPIIEIIVVDNDPAGSACELCEEVGRELGWSLECHVEPRRGIPYVRNKAVASVKEGTDFIAFIDDDEVPEPSWLDELLYVQQSCGADVVSGPVLPHFIGAVPNWITKGKFFERPRRPTGQLLNVAATNNVLVRSEVFSKIGELFDVRYARTGVDDTLFFMRVHRAGYKMVWADNAWVYEWIPQSRANTRWILQRAYRSGNSWILVELNFRPWAMVGLVRSATASMRIAQGLLLVTLSPGLGYHVFVKGLGYIGLGVGLLTGLAGMRYEEYRKKTHGT